MSVLELRDVTIRYPGASGASVTITEGFDLGLEPGAMHCLAGRSGSGKTSLLRVAAGLARPSEGQVYWDGRSIGELSDDATARARREHIGYLDQGGILMPGLAALENVLLPAVPSRRVTELLPRALKLLERLGVADRADNRPGALSGGERQRVALARALLLSPPILMVDEPTASLDRASADTVISILRELADDGTAVLVSAHDEKLIAASDSRTHLS